MGASPPQELNNRHHAIIDHMLAFPDRKLGEIAEDLGYSSSWLSTIINSHAFKLEYQRRREQFNTQLNDKTQRRMYDVALKAADKMEDVLDEEDLDPSFVLDSFDKTLKNLGFGGKQPSPAGGPQAVQNNFYSVPPEDLARARERMSSHHGYTVEGECHSKENEE